MDRPHHLNASAQLMTWTCNHCTVSDSHRYPFYRRVAAVAYKKSWSFCSDRLRLNTYAPYLRGFVGSDVTRCMVVWCTQCTQNAVSRGISYAPTKQRRMYTTRVDIQKLQSLIQNSMRQKRSETAGERRIVPYKSDQQLLITNKELWTGSSKGLNADHVVDMSYHSAVNDLQQ